MPLKHLFIAAALALALPGAPAAFAQPPAAPLPLYVVEGETRLVSLADGGGVGRTTVYVSQPPAHGQLLLAFPEMRYKPQDGYFGSDWVRLEIHGSGQITYRDFDIAVLPRRIALQALWSAFSTAGLYDVASGHFQVCDDVLDQEVGPLSGLLYFPLICAWVPVNGAPPRAIPVALQGEPGVADEFLLFAPETGLLYQLAQSGGGFLVVNRELVPGSIGSFPIAGRFAPGAAESIAFVGRQGQVQVRGPAGELIAWSQPIWSPTGAGLVWPVRWNLADRDALALVDAAGGTIRWRAADGASGTAALNGGGDLRRPFDIYHSAASGRILALQSTPLDGELIFRHFFGNFTTESSQPTPTTYPLKFPDDPPGP